MTKPLIYVAGPYTNPDPVWNTNTAVKTGLRLVDTGLCAVIIPHVTMLVHLVDPRPYEFWLAFDLDQMAHCDAILRMPGASSGADAEVSVAIQAGQLVFYNETALINWLSEGASSRA